MVGPAVPSATVPAEKETKPELFTVLVTGKGIRMRARVPGWVAAAVFKFAKENDERVAGASRG